MRNALRITLAIIALTAVSSAQSVRYHISYPRSMTLRDAFTGQHVTTWHSIGTAHPANDCYPYRYVYSSRVSSLEQITIPARDRYRDEIEECRKRVKKLEKRLRKRKQK